MHLPIGDKTPAHFKIETISSKEKVKKIIRHYIYPFFVRQQSRKIEKRFPSIKDMGFDELFLGQRGNDYESHRRRVNRFIKIKDSTILIIGIGTGKDLESWLKFKPKKIIAIDYFTYDIAWKMRKECYGSKYVTEIEFIQADITDLNAIASESIDIIASDAVLEHINAMGQALHELYRVLKKDGLFYSNFGPLWYSWGGDHISGADALINGYNHLILSENDYHAYLETLDAYKQNQNNCKIWLIHNLFSYLKPSEYLDAAQNTGFIKRYISCIIDPKALTYQKQFPELFQKIAQKYGETNLLISAMTIIYVK